MIGSYRIVKKIGKGRFGLVKLGEHLTSGVQVAIKIVDKSGLNVVESNSIKTEAEVMTCLNHPNVVRLLEVIETKYELALIMEYAAGGDLFEYVMGDQKRRKLGEKEVRRLFVQVVAGLAYCHRHFVVHRDIKAENILLDASGNVRIGDWGFSSVYHPGLTIETACGSLDYAAPEVLTGLVSFGPSVDIWALGVLLYFLLTARLPFSAPNDFDVYQLIKKAEYKKPKGVSKEAKSLLKALLNPNAHTRITIAEVETHPWISANLDLSATPAPAPAGGAGNVFLQPNNFVSSQASSLIQVHVLPSPSLPPKDSSLNTSDSHSIAASASSKSQIISASNSNSTLQASTTTSSSNTTITTSSKRSSTVSTKKKSASGSSKGNKKRSISDTKLEQTMHQLKAGSGSQESRANRASGRRNSTLRSAAEKSKLKDLGLGNFSSSAGLDPFNTITEEVDEEEDIAATSSSHNNTLHVGALGSSGGANSHDHHRHRRNHHRHNDEDEGVSDDDAGDSSEEEESHGLVFTKLSEVSPLIIPTSSSSAQIIVPSSSTNTSTSSSPNKDGTTSSDPNTTETNSQEILQETSSPRIKLSGSSGIIENPDTHTPTKHTIIHGDRVPSPGRKGNSHGSPSSNALPKASSTGRLSSTGTAPLSISGFIVSSAGGSGGSPRSGSKTLDSPSSTTSPRGSNCEVSSSSNPSSSYEVLSTSCGENDRQENENDQNLDLSSPRQTGDAIGTSNTGSSPSIDTPGRSGKRTKSEKKARSFNTEKTKAELSGVSRFIILKLSAAQLEQLKDMPEFEILQVTTKTTLKEEPLMTVVVATRVPNSRKYLKRFEQSRRLFRWNSDTHFGLRSRAKNEALQNGATPPSTPARINSFRVSTPAPIPFTVSSAVVAATSAENAKFEIASLRASHKSRSGDLETYSASKDSIEDDTYWQEDEDESDSSSSSSSGSSGSSTPPHSPNSRSLSSTTKTVHSNMGASESTTAENSSTSSASSRESQGSKGSPTSSSASYRASSSSFAAAGVVPDDDFGTTKVKSGNSASSPPTSASSSSRSASTSPVQSNTTSSSGASASSTPKKGHGSPTQARRRRKSITDKQTDTAVVNVAQHSPGGASKVHVSGANASSTSSGPSSPSAASSSRPTLTRPLAASSSGTSAVSRTAPGKGKLAKMHSWSQSEFDNAVPGTLKKQFASSAAMPPGSPSLFKSFRKKRSDNTGNSNGDNTANSGISPIMGSDSSSSAKRASADSQNTSSSTDTTTLRDEEAENSRSSDDRRTFSMKIESSVSSEPLPPAPGSSPAKIASPKSKSRHKKKDAHSSSSSSSPAQH